MSACAVCDVQQADLGVPSEARWKGPDGGEYCSMHFVQRFGHSERLVKIEDYEPPKTVKPPAPKKKEEASA